ncbi:MAG: molybdate ABC transporter substrate-binding protein [Syntrophomonadaceae bacterium]|nr:molybdate ABC transporter substrate-binding protein [Syntrophomonadaceae bacterium]MDD3023647.1 molybdate ABC transporter substrate-binding protein [Syntrophomonadaceae bacterium]
MYFNKKSKISISIIISCLFILMVAGLAFAAPAGNNASSPVLMKAGDQCTVNVKTALNVRTGPGTNYRVFKSLPKGAELTVVKQSGDWYEVKGSDAKSGFVYGKYLALSASSPNAAAPAPVPVTPAPVQRFSGQVELTVSAASSLTDVMKEIEKQYESEYPNVQLTLNLASSGSLQQQIEQGAPADLFFSAATKQMKALQDKNLIINETNKNLLKNGIVLVVPKTSEKIKGFDDLKKARVIAIGEPDSVPAGQYGKDVLTSIKMWDSLKDKMVFAKNVRQVLAYVESGDADAGIVYATDAKISDKVKVAAVAEEWTHTPVVYPAAVVKSSKQVDAAKALLNYLSGDKAKTIFEKYGFSTVSK